MGEFLPILTFGRAWGGVEVAAVLADEEVLVIKGATSFFRASTPIIASLFDAPTSVELFVPMSVVAALDLAPLLTQWSTALPVLSWDVDVRNSSRPMKGSKMETLNKTSCWTFVRHCSSICTL